MKREENLEKIMTFDYVLWKIRQDADQGHLVPTSEPDLHIPETSRTSGEFIWTNENLVITYAGILDQGCSYELVFDQVMSGRAYLYNNINDPGHMGEVIRAWFGELDKILLEDEDEG